MKKRVLLLMGMIVFLSVFVSADTIFSDGFESGTLGGWEVTSNWHANNTGVVGDGIPFGSWEMISSNSGASVYSQRNISTSGYSSIVFDFYYKTDTNLLDSGEYFTGEWFDGATWTVVFNISGASTSYLLNHNVLGIGANNNPNFKIRFGCNSNLGTEGCAIDNVSVSGNVFDTTPPSFSNYVENPGNNSAYVQGQTYAFNVTINEANAVNRTIIQFNGVNYTGSSFIRNVSNVYIFNRTDLAAGSYTYKWFANDTNGNLGVSNEITYAIAKTTGQVGLLLNWVANNLSVTYGTQTNASASTSYGSVTLYRNGTDVTTSENRQNVTFGVGYYNYTAVSPGDQNHSMASVSYFLDITRASTTTNILINPLSPITYGTNSNFSCSNSAGLSTILYINGTNKDSEKNLNVLRAAGTYAVNCTSSDNQNYTGSSQQISYTINKATPTASLTNSQSWNINYGTSAAISSSESNAGDSDLTYSIWRDSVNKGTSDSGILGVGSYSYILNTSGGQNYTEVAILDSNTLVVNKTNPATNMLITITPSSTVDYGTSTSADSSETNSGDSDLTYTLYRNDSGAVSDPNVITLNAGTYTYIFNTTGGANYTYGSVNSTLIVNKIGNLVSLFLNGQQSNISINYPQQFNVSAYSTSGIVGLFRNGTDVGLENKNNVSLAAGFYEYFANSSGDQNYLENSSGKMFYLVINKASSQIFLYLNDSRSNISITEGTTIPINASLQQGQGDIVVYNNGSLIYQGVSPLTNLTNFSVAGFYNITAIYPESQNSSSSSETWWVNVTPAPDLAGPTITLSKPEAMVYGVNTSLTLEFSVSDLSNVSSCWYNLNSTSNISLVGCQNSTFNVSSDGGYILTLFSNDSLGNVANTSVTFSVLTTAPALNLVSPMDNSYLNYINNVYFNYSAFSGIGISSCQLFGNFSGNWELNQTNSLITQESNYFVLNLTEGTYLWGVFCNDTQNRKSSANRTFILDITSPTTNILSPIGTINTNNVTFNFSISDSMGLNYCSYNVTTSGGGIIVAENSINCSSSLEYQTISDGVSYILNVFANDSAGNSNTSSSSFSVSTSLSSSSSSSSSSGGGGSSSGGGGGGGAGAAKKIGIDVGKISDLTISKGGVKKVNSWRVKNTGTSYLNDCKFKSQGDKSFWIPYTETKGLAAGEEYEFVFDINIPEDAVAGEYNLKVFLDCKEINRTGEFVVEILGKQLEFTITNVERQANDKVSVGYTLENLIDSDQNVDLQFLLFDPDKKQVAEVNNSVFIPAIDKRDFETIIPIDENLQGELSLLINVNSETYSTFVQENIILGKSIGGFAIFGNAGTRDKMISGLIVLLFLGFAFMMIKKIKSHHKIIRHEHLKKKYAFLMYDSAF